MNIKILKMEYLNLTGICSKIDYSDKNSVKKNNSAVKRMYEIVDLISEMKELKF